MTSQSLARLLVGWPDSGRGPAYERLARVTAALLLDGRLLPHTRLPAERDLARALGVSRTTVTAAYARLRDDGFLLSRQGAGSWTVLPARPSRSLAPLGFRPDGDRDDGSLDLAIAAPGPAPELLGGAVAEAGRLFAAELARAGLGTTSAGHGYYPAGLPMLRDAVAARFTARGVPTTAEQILITAGALGAVHLAARRLLSGRDVALVEQPTYPNAVDALRRTGTRLVGLPVSSDGWDPDLLAAAFAQARPRVAYMIPDFQNPTGALLDVGGRERLVAAARAAGSVLLCDETLVDLPLDGQERPPPLAAFDTDDRVVTIGSLSKAVWGGLRIGWLRGQRRLIEELAAERSTIDLAGPVYEQYLAAVVLGGLDALLPARRTDLAARRDVLIEELAARLPEWRWRTPGGGLALWVRLDAPMSTALADAGERHGLRLAAGPRFGLDGTLERFLRIPYTLAPDDLIEAVRRLAAARADALGPHATSSSRPAVVA